MKPSSIWVWALLGTAACAQAAPLDARAERARIAREQSAAESLFRAREAQCLTQFVVSSCIDRARAEQRDTLQRLRSERAVLDDMQRRQRAAQRLQGIEEKHRAAAARPAPPVAASVPALAQAPPKAPPPPASEAPTPKPNKAPDAAEAAKRAAARQQRERQAERHRVEVEARNAQRPPAAPLPVPSAASAAAN